MICCQVGCNNVATHKVYWPGNRPLEVCMMHAKTAKGVASAIGMYVAIEELYDPTREDQNDSKDSKGEVY